MVMNNYHNALIEALINQVKIFDKIGQKLHRNDRIRGISKQLFKKKSIINEMGDNKFRK